MFMGQISRVEKRRRENNPMSGVFLVAAALNVVLVLIAVAAEAAPAPDNSGEIYNPYSK